MSVSLKKFPCGSLGAGVMQILRCLPDFHVRGSTIAKGSPVGLVHEDALRFSLLLATPIIAAAAAIKLQMWLLREMGQGSRRHW
jgi:undecaprenyl-diphosphatase